MRMLRTYAVVAACALVAGGAKKAAGVGLGQARATGMAGAYTALATGIHAPWWNPANLAARRGPKVEIGLLNVGFLAGNDGIRYGDFLDWTSDELLTTEEMQQALDQFPGSSVSIHQNTELGVPFLSVAVGRVAVSMRVVQMAEVGLPRGIIDALTYTGSYEEARTKGIVRDLSGVKSDLWALGIVGVSYARLFDVEPFRRFAVGATLNSYLATPRFHVVESTGHILERPNTWQSDARLVVETGGISITRTPRPDGGKDTEVEVDPLGGWGLGVNLGVAGVWGKDLYFSAALHNLPIRKITWKTAERRTFVLNNGGRIVNAETIFADKPEEQDMLDYLDTLFAPAGESVERLEKLGSLSAAPPVYFRAGVAQDFFRHLLTWSFDVEQGFTTTAITSTTPRLASGVEVRPLGPWMQLRAGMSIGGRSGHFATLGIGFAFPGMRFDMALINEGAFTPLEVPFTGRARGVGFATELRLTL